MELISIRWVIFLELLIFFLASRPDDLVFLPPEILHSCYYARRFDVLLQVIEISVQHGNGDFKGFLIVNFKDRHNSIVLTGTLGLVLFRYQTQGSLVKGLGSRFSIGRRRIDWLLNSTTPTFFGSRFFFYFFFLVCDSLIRQKYDKHPRKARRKDRHRYSSRHRVKSHCRDMTLPIITK